MADEEKTITKDGYELTLYPGFASRCVVREAAGGEYELYRQEGPYHLPHGQTKPKNKFQLRLKGGMNKQDVTFDVSDPSHRIKRIVVEFYGEGHQPGLGTEEATVETLEVENDSKLCPPSC